MPFIPTAPIRVQPYLGYRSTERLYLTARVLRARQDNFAGGGRTGGWRAMRIMLGQFVTHEVEGLAVELEIAAPDGTRTRHRAHSDGEGYVRFDIPLEGAWPYAAHPEWETVTLHWRAGGTDMALGGHVLAPGTATRLAVVSDIDDTIIETGITGNVRAVLRNWRRVLLELPEDRILVPGADVFYAALGGGAGRPDDRGHAGMHRAATRRPFFYVSSSPWNLFSYLVAYMQGRGLPLGPVLLRDWGLNRATFGSGSHGAHKCAAIERLFATYPTMRFALIGDDSQGDLTAFGDLAVRHPGRVQAVFIRKLGAAMDDAEIAAEAALRAAGIPLWIGTAYEEGRRFLEALGLSRDGEAETIIEAATATGADAAASPATAMAAR